MRGCCRFWTTLHLTCAQSRMHATNGVPLITVKVASRQMSILQKEGHAKSQNTPPCCPRHNVQSTLTHNFRVSYALTRPSILPVFKRLTACFNPSRQSSAPLAHALYRHPLTYHVLLSSLLSPLDAIHNSRKRIAW